MIAMIRKAAPSVARVAVAPFASLGRGAVAGGALTWLLHFLLVGLTLFGLWRLNGYLELDKVVRAPSSLLRELWLPIMFLLAYAIGWTALATWRTATSPGVSSDFPELDSCWAQLTASMHRHGIDLAHKPLVLLLGEPAGREADLLSSFAITPTFGPTPSQPSAMLRVFADDRAVYLMCHESSLLSVAAERLAQVRGCRKHTSQMAVLNNSLEQKMPVALRTRVTAGASADPAQDHAAAAAPRDQVTPEVATIGERLAALNAAASRIPDLFNELQAERCAAELDHLVRLIRSERGGAAPIDGIAALVPVDASDSDQAADEFSWALAQDLQVIGDAGGMRCPVASVVSDLQHAPGCGLLLHVLPSDRKKKHFGVALDSRRSENAEATAEAIDELLTDMAAVLSQRLMQVDESGGGGWDSLSDNASLFAFQSYLSGRGVRLARLISDALHAGPSAPWPHTGCYLVATGDALGASQAFGAGVLQTLSERPSSATWTPEALARDARHTRAAAMGYAGLAAACAAVAWLYSG